MQEFHDIWSFTPSLECANPEGQWQSLSVKGIKEIPFKMGMAFCQKENFLFFHGGQNFELNEHYDIFYKLDLGLIIFLSFFFNNS